MILKMLPGLRVVTAPPGSVVYTVVAYKDMVRWYSENGLSDPFPIGYELAPHSDWTIIYPGWRIFYESIN